MGHEHNLVWCLFASGAPTWHSNLSKDLAEGTIQEVRTYGASAVHKQMGHICSICIHTGTDDVCAMIRDICMQLFRLAGVVHLHPFAGLRGTCVQFLCLCANLEGQTQPKPD
jgi:hypothetical protein